MSKPLSLASFVRKELDIKGKNEMTPRSMRMCMVGTLNFFTFFPYLQGKIIDWKCKGLILDEKEQISVTGILHCVILFSKKFGPNNRIFYTNSRMIKNNILGIIVQTTPTQIRLNMNEFLTKHTLKNGV